MHPTQQKLLVYKTDLQALTLVGTTREDPLAVLHLENRLSITIFGNLTLTLFITFVNSLSSFHGGQKLGFDLCGFDI